MYKILICESNNQELQSDQFIISLFDSLSDETCIFDIHSKNENHYDHCRNSPRLEL